MNRRYVVVNENTLGIIYGPKADSLHVLAGSVIRGGRDPKNGEMYIGSLDVVRDATVEDFAAYRVSPKGHLT